MACRWIYLWLMDPAEAGGNVTLGLGLVALGVEPLEIVSSILAACTQGLNVVNLPAGARPGLLPVGWARAGPLELRPHYARAVASEG